MIAARRLTTRAPALATFYRDRRRYFVTSATSEAVQDTTSQSSHIPFFPDEPSGPYMRTPVPGPESKRIMERLNQYQDTRSVFFIAGKHCP